MGLRCTHAECPRPQSAGAPHLAFEIWVCGMPAGDALVAAWSNAEGLLPPSRHFSCGVEEADPLIPSARPIHHALDAEWIPAPQLLRQRSIREVLVADRPDEAEDGACAH